MRFFDLAVAGLIGVASLTTLVAWNPLPFDASAVESTRQSSMRAELLRFVEGSGLVWLQSAQPSEVCSKLAGMSNSSVVFSASIDGATCTPPPSPGSTPVELAVLLPGRELVLYAWSGAKG